MVRQAGTEDSALPSVTFSLTPSNCHVVRQAGTEDSALPSVTFSLTPSNCHVVRQAGTEDSALPSVTFSLPSNCHVVRQAGTEDSALPSVTFSLTPSNCHVVQAGKCPSCNLFPHTIQLSVRQAWPDQKSKCPSFCNLFLTPYMVNQRALLAYSKGIYRKPQMGFPPILQCTRTINKKSFPVH